MNQLTLLNSTSVLILLLLAVSGFCLVYGFWVGRRDRSAARQAREAFSAPPDEEILIFERVTDELSQLPHLEAPGVLWTAQKNVMRRVGEHYGVKPAEVGIIYWRVWLWKHGAAR